MENEFLCRSYLYKDSDSSLEYNCQLFHLDHFTLPDGPSTFLTTDRPLLDDGEPTGKFVENICQSKLSFISYLLPLLWMSCRPKKFNRVARLCLLDPISLSVLMNDDLLGATVASFIQCKLLNLIGALPL